MANKILFIHIVQVGSNILTCSWSKFSKIIVVIWESDIVGCDVKWHIIAVVPFLARDVLVGVELLHHISRTHATDASLDIVG